jgi:hypothetical protein
MTLSMTNVSDTTAQMMNTAQTSLLPSCFI